MNRLYNIIEPFPALLRLTAISDLAIYLFTIALYCTMYNVHVCVLANNLLKINETYVPGPNKNLRKLLMIVFV